MKVLLIGGTGCLSTDVSRKIVSDNQFELYLLNRGNRKKDIPEGANVIIGDIRNAKQVRENIKDFYFDVVVDFLSYVPSQLEATIGAVEGHYNQYIFISSSAVYDFKRIGERPIKEDDLQGGKSWDYSIGKIECEKWLKNYFSDKKTVYTIIRPFFTYNDQRLPYALNPDYHHTWSIIRRIMEDKPIVMWGDGNNCVPFTSTRDFANAVVATFNNEIAFNNAFHIATESRYSWNSVLQIVGKLLNKEVNIICLPTEKIIDVFPEYTGPITEDKNFELYVDNSKIKSICPQFNNLIDIETGMKLMLDYHLNNKDEQNVDYLWDAKMDTLINQCAKQNTAIRRMKSFYLEDGVKLTKKQRIKLFISSNRILRKVYKSWRTR